jgi:hypothetical protein
VHVPGVYAALLAYERTRYERRGGEPVLVDGREIGKKVPAAVDEHGKGGFIYPRRHLLNSLEAGGSVVVGRGRVELALWERDRPPTHVRLREADAAYLGLTRWLGQ